MGEQEGKPDGEKPNDATEWNEVGEPALLGYEAALTGDQANGEHQRQALGVGVTSGRAVACRGCVPQRWVALGAELPLCPVAFVGGFCPSAWQDAKISKTLLP